MPWRSDVPSGVDPQGGLFAHNAETEQAALKAIDAAKRAGATRDEFAKELLWHLHSNPFSRGDVQAFMDAQIERLNALWTTS